MNREEMPKWIEKYGTAINYPIKIDINTIRCSCQGMDKEDIYNLILDLEKKNIDLQEQLQQRNEVIEKLMDNIEGDIDGFQTINEFGSCNDIIEILYIYKDILTKYKGYNNE